MGETARMFGTRMDEHKDEAEKVGNEPQTRAMKKASLTEDFKSAITDHVAD